MRPNSAEEHLASVEDAAAFLAEAQAELDVRRLELDRRIVAARTARVALRRIASVAGLSHQQINRIGKQ